MTQEQEIPAGYAAIYDSGYIYAELRVGVALRNPAGKEVYFQPGDDTAAILDTIEALDSIPEDRRAIVADMAFSEYFA